eukprot:gene14832-17010_t
MSKNEEVISPLSNHSPRSTLYDKLNLLSAEISEGVINLSDGKRWLIENELRLLREEADREVSPEAVYNLLLFRKYSNIANLLKERNVDLEVRIQTLAHSRDDSSMFDIAHGTVDGQGEAVLVGFDAVKSNIFWLRVLAAMFSFISFVVMSQVPYVSRATFSPGAHSEADCPYTITSGSFNMRPYQFVIGAGVLIYIHTLITSMYYLLPVDDNNEKYVPGLRDLVSLLLNDVDQTEDCMTSMSAVARTLSRALEFVADFCLVVLSLVAFIIAAITVDQPIKFQHDYIELVYFNLQSYYETATHTYPQCTSSEDPVPMIRASLAMLFFAIIVMFVCLQVSYRAVKQEWTHRTPPSGHTASDIGSRGVHTFEGREAFLSQPLATSEEEVDVEQGVRGAAYARSNNRSNGGRERKESSSDEEVSLDFQTISTIRRSQEAMERPAAPASTAASDNHTSQSENNKAKGRGAAIMRNHEAQRFASARPVAPTMRAAPVVSSGSNSPSRNSPQNTERAQQSAGESNFEEVEEADL